MLIRYLERSLDPGFSFCDTPKTEEMKIVAILNARVKWKIRFEHVTMQPERPLDPGISFCDTPRFDRESPVAICNARVKRNVRLELSY